jgi:chromosome segregation ATPase
MTIDEITRTLQTVAENQAQHDKELGALIQSQSRSEERHARLDEAFKQVAVAIEQLTQLAITTDGRLDDLEEAHRDTDARLNALIDSQMRLGEKVDKLTADIVVTSGQVETLTADIAAVNGRVVRTDERLDRIGEYIEEHSRHLARTDERLDRIGEYIEEHSRHLARIDKRLDQVVALQAENAEHIKALLVAQTMALPKPKAGAEKKARKSSKKGVK